MIVVYADGGGLGHLTRVQAVRRQLGLDDPVVVLTTSDAVTDDRVTAGLRVVTIPFTRHEVEARRSWLARTIAELEPSLFLVDAFPCGLAGEIDAATVSSSVPTLHLARLLRWDAYRDLVPPHPLRYGTTYVLEPLHPDHREFLVSVADSLTPLDLTDPEPGPEPAPSTDVWPTAPGRPRWLVVHSGPASEVDELVAYAHDQAAAERVTVDLVVSTLVENASSRWPDLVVIGPHPVPPYFPIADRIVTAAGFNTMRELAPFRERHRFLALPRRFDDQFERARRARRSAGGGPEEPPAGSASRR